eukprot:Partr_v1_DN28780_c1_g1_i3_m62841 putative inositol-tetrakisphosphate 1-kinase
MPLIGVLLSEKKVQKSGFSTLLRGERDDVRVQLVDMAIRAVDQPHFDVIIHKVTDLLQDPSRRDSVVELMTHFESLGNVLVLDSLANVLPIMDRGRMLSILDRATVDSAHFVVPQYQIVDIKDISWLTLRFPLVIKNVASCSSIKAHEMGILRSNLSSHDVNALSQVMGTVVLQRYIIHIPILYKVYVFGSFQTVQMRPSIQLSSEISSITWFNSQSLPKRFPNDAIPHGAALSADKIQAIHGFSEKLAQVSGLSMFGYDFVIDAETGLMNVFDLNYFPGFHGIEGFDDVIVTNVKKAYKVATSTV